MEDQLATATTTGMSWLEFIASIVGSLVALAWPAAIVASVWLFRKEIRRLLPMLKLRHGDTEVSFRLEDAERTIEQLPPQQPEEKPLPEEIDKFAELARLSPRSAVLQLRREVEEILKREAREHHIQFTSTRQVMRVLRSRNLIGSIAASLLDDVLAIGNVAAHESSAPFSTKDAIRYREIVDRAVSLLHHSPASDDFGPVDLNSN